jgi:mannan endo-1,4-beta-mannosidase
MDFGSFQYFPDQNKYGPDDPNLTPFENVVNTGNEWIRQQGEVSSTYGKPITLNAFGLVTQDNLPHFSPFSAPFGSDAPPAQAPIGVSNGQRNDAYKSWIDTGLTSGLTSMFQYQWGQPELSVSPGTPVGTSTDSTGVVTTGGTTGVSPNDGYSINDQGRQSVIDVIQQGNQAFGSDTLLSRR